MLDFFIPFITYLMSPILYIIARYLISYILLIIFNYVPTADCIPTGIAL